MIVKLKGEYKNCRYKAFKNRDNWRNWMQKEEFRGGEHKLDFWRKLKDKNRDSWKYTREECWIKGHGNKNISKIRIT